MSRAYYSAPLENFLNDEDDLILGELTRQHQFSLEELQKNHTIELHTIAHSAGSILFGYWLKQLQKRKMHVSSATLLAPACSIEFANKFYTKAHKKKVLHYFFFISRFIKTNIF